MLLVLHSARDGEFVKRTLLGVRCARQDVDELDRFLPDDSFDVAPEIFAAEQSSQVRPRTVSDTGKLLASASEQKTLFS